MILFIDLFYGAIRCWKEAYTWLSEKEWQTNQINTYSQWYIRTHLTTDDSIQLNQEEVKWEVKTVVWYNEFSLCVIFFPAFKSNICVHYRKKVIYRSKKKKRKISPKIRWLLLSNLSLHGFPLTLLSLTCEGQSTKERLFSD